MAFRIKNGMTSKVALSVAVLLACVGVTHTASSFAVIPDDQKAVLTIQGQGARPNSEVSLSTGPQQKIVTKADPSGQFVFSNLKYQSFTNLRFAIDIAPSDKGLSKISTNNHLEFSFDARESLANMKGQIGKYGTLAFNMAGANEGKLTVAGQEGYVDLQARTMLPLSSGQSIMTASIVNASETCCPKLIVPAPPITLTIMSEAIQAAMPLPKPAPGAVYPNSGAVPAKVAPVPAPVKPAENAPAKAKPNQSAPVILLPKKDGEEQKAPENKKPLNPYIIQGQVDFETVVSDEVSSAVSFSKADFDNTYVGGIKKILDEIRNTIVAQTAVIGTFIDGRNFMDTTRSIQVSTAQTLRKYTASDQVCKFGTLTTSIAASNAVETKNKLALAKLLQDRDVQKMGGLFENSGTGVNSILIDMRAKYCSGVSNSGFLAEYCDTAKATSDLVYNRDVDFTRVLDVPLTLDADFSDNSTSTDKEAVIALLANLSKVPVVSSRGEGGFDPKSNSKQAQDIRALNAMKSVSANSFASLVAEKSKSKSESAKYMKEMMLGLGVPSGEVTKLIGENPSYFAQMEVMTKKLFQNPEFYANLYDSEANVDRQRVAMKAIELQQDRDFLESLRRREMLLSTLLNARLRYESGRANTSGTVVAK